MKTKKTRLCEYNDFQLQPLIVQLSKAIVLLMGVDE